MRTTKITVLLARWREGDPGAFDELIVRVFDELRRLACARLALERRDHTLQPTELVHEVYLRLVGGTQLSWQNRAHFFGACARTMRRILVDHARRRHAAKRGAGVTVLSLNALAHEPGGRATPIVRLLALDVCLRRLEELDARQSRVVELRFFGGLSINEVAAVLGVSPRTVKSDWTKARAWLAHALQGR